MVLTSWETDLLTLDVDVRFGRYGGPHNAYYNNLGKMLSDCSLLEFLEKQYGMDFLNLSKQAKKEK